MIVAQFQLRNRTHHAVGFDASDRGNFQHHAICGNDCAGWAEYAKHACACIGCATDHLKRLAACSDGQHLQFIRLRMRRRTQHLCNAERGQFFCRVFDALNLKPDTVQAIGNGLHIGVGIKMLFQP